MLKKLFLGAVVIMTLTACGGETETIEATVDENEEITNGNSEGNNSNANEDVNEDVNEEGNEEGSIQEETASEVIVDENGIKITYTGLEVKTDSVFGNEARIKFEIENDTENLITIQQRNLSIDGYMVDEATVSFSQDVSAGKKANGSISIMEFDGYDFPEFKENLEFQIVAIEEESWEHILEKQVSLSIQNGSAESAAKDGEDDSNEDTNGLLLVDEEGIIITYTGFQIEEDDIFGAEANINFSIENNTDKLITVQQRNLSVDGYMVDEAIVSFSQDVTAGKKANGSISVMDFEDYDFPEFNEDMQFDIVVIDEDSWDYIIEESVEITIE